MLVYPLHSAIALSTTSVIANRFSSSSLRPTSCRLTGIPCTDSAESGFVSICTHQVLKYRPLTIIPNLCVPITQCLRVGICCINVLIGINTTRERNSRIIEQIIDTCIPGVSELAILDTAVWRRGACGNKSIKKPLAEADGLT